jgi:hypothetical protein
MRELTKAEHLDLLKRAIAANLEARTELQIRDDNEPGPGVLKVISAAELMDTPDEKLRLEEIIGNATLRALQKQIRDLGKELHRLLGSKDGMLEVAEEVANLDRRNWEYRINIIDKNWDGIGGWAA